MASIQSGPSTVATFSFWAQIFPSLSHKICFVVTNNICLIYCFLWSYWFVLIVIFSCLVAIIADNGILKLSFYFPLVSECLMRFITEQFRIKCRWVTLRKCQINFSKIIKNFFFKSIWAITCSISSGLLSLQHFG